jgi:hypothetical protein
MTMVEKSYSVPQNYKLGDRVVIHVNGYFRPWEVVGILADRKHFLFGNTTFGPSCL